VDHPFDVGQPHVSSGVSIGQPRYPTRQCQAIADAADRRLLRYLSARRSHRPMRRTAREIEVSKPRHAGRLATRQLRGCDRGPWRAPGLIGDENRGQSRRAGWSLARDRLVDFSRSDGADQAGWRAARPLTVATMDGCSAVPDRRSYPPSQPSDRAGAIAAAPPPGSSPRPRSPSSASWPLPIHASLPVEVANAVQPIDHPARSSRLSAGMAQVSGWQTRGKRPGGGANDSRTHFEIGARRSRRRARFSREFKHDRDRVTLPCTLGGSSWACRATRCRSRGSTHPTSQRPRGHPRPPLDRRRRRPTRHRHRPGDRSRAGADRGRRSESTVTAGHTVPSESQTV
jgi:hypothetical protein